MDRGQIRRDSSRPSWVHRVRPREKDGDGGYSEGSVGKFGKKLRARRRAREQAKDARRRAARGCASSADGRRIG